MFYYIYKRDGNNNNSIESQALYESAMQNLYQDKNEYKNYVARFVDDCNTPGALGCIWIVRVKVGFCNGGRPDVTAQRAFESHDEHIFMVDNFADWWWNTYLRYNPSTTNHTWVEIYTNYSPTEICVPKLEDWLRRNPHVTRLNIHFGFFYTWSRGRRVVPVNEYIRRLQNLGNFPYASVRIMKINAHVLFKLAREAGVHFTGYRRPCHSNDDLEREIINHY